LPQKKGQKNGKQIKICASVGANGIAKIYTPGTAKHLAVFRSPFKKMFIEKIRKIIDKYFWIILLVFIFAIAFVMFQSVKMAMAEDPTPTPTPTPTETPTPTSFAVDENFEVLINGTTTPFIFSNTWTAPDIMIVGLLSFLTLFLVAKTIIAGVIKFYVAIKRKYQ
jgi:hypothetical protein